MYLRKSVAGYLHSDTDYYVNKPCVLPSQCQPLPSARKQVLADLHALRIFLEGLDL